jgi:hypothetical protein
MVGTWRTERLPEIVRTLAERTGRPRHEVLRPLIVELLRSAFNVPYEQIGQEVYLTTGQGRIDTMFGATVIEIKSDLRRELADVLDRMPHYLRDAALRTRRSVTGLATDGAMFIAYELRDGHLIELAHYVTNVDRPDDLVGWLEPLLSDRTDLVPEPRAIEQAFGRRSVTFARARAMLASLWETLRADPEVALKRDLWDGLLRQAYGDPVGEDALFLQHTYLTVVVKAIAACVLDLPVNDPAALLGGRALAEAGIQGAVEADFFDWVLRAAAGSELVRRIALEAARFRLRDVEADVLKALYESLVDPEQRHDLGEYYTPDWLAARVVEAAIPAPLSSRVLDPASGSGTFLFHAVRHLIASAQRAGWGGERILLACSEQVRGLDVHPVAVIIARVTWLLALGGLIAERRATLRVPVFLGDALQWNLREYVGGRDVLVPVPGERPLQIPAGLAENQEQFEAGLDALTDGLREEATPAQVVQALRRIAAVGTADAEALADTYTHLQTLYRAGRNGIWTFVLRNLVRPVWLSREEQRADVLVGNPPWIAYRHLSADMKEALREGLLGYKGGVGGNLATQQDMCALFWARCVDRYLRPGGAIGFVLPYAVLNATAFAGLRGGEMGQARVRLTGAWALEKVWPIFGAQSGSSTTSTCVLFGRRQAPAGLPATIDRWTGLLPRRDANAAEAAHALTHTRVPWPPERLLAGASPYRERFRDGATVYPRRFFLVEPEAGGRLGVRRAAPRVRGRTGKLDKHPWNTVEPPQGPVEEVFLRRLLLGETIAPYRLLEPALAVIPLDGATLLDAAAARAAGHRYLAAWLRDIETKWAQHSNRTTAGAPRMTLSAQLDHMRKLSVQSQPASVRVVYTKAGTRLSAALLNDTATVVDHKAYWAPARSVNEGRYLTAIVNSAAVLRKIVDYQPHGQRDPRDFDKLVWTLPIPDYSDADPLHRDLAAAAARAEEVAALVDMSGIGHFTAGRRAIRAALAADGIGAEIEALVTALLPI